MTRARLLIFVLLAAAAGCLAVVLNDRYAAGNVYSEYSSQRTDPLGTKAIYEALSKLRPDVSRNEVPLSTLTPKDSLILIAGQSPAELDSAYIGTLQSLAKAGNRVVVAFDGGEYIFNPKQEFKPLADKWQVRMVDRRPEVKQPSQSFLFQPAAKSGWRRVGPGIERSFGGGAVFLIGTSYPLTNEALRDARDTAFLTAAFGDASRIIFDETHLGSVESGTIMGLARRFRLQGVIAVSILCALLFIWQSSAPFPPERISSSGEDFRLFAASAGEGLRNLLAHHIPANRLIGACVAEWRKDRGRLAPADQLARMESIAAQRYTDPITQWREIRATLDGKRKLK